MIVQLLKRARRQKPRVPDGVRIYAIGDVHGRADLLDKLLLRIARDVQKRPATRPIIVTIGDYIDRGPGSKDVLDLLAAATKQHELVLLRGNHDVMLGEFLREPATLSEWARVGGFETLMSYGLKPSLAAELTEQKRLAAELNTVLPIRHRLLLEHLTLSFTCGSYFFVHAGVRPGVPLSAQREADLLWIRDEFLLSEESFGKVVVHGHTPVREIEMKSNRINIDTGAYATGRLSAISIQADRIEPFAA